MRHAIRAGRPGRPSLCLPRPVDVRELGAVVDEIVCPTTPSPFFAAGQSGPSHVLTTRTTRAGSPVLRGGEAGHTRAKELPGSAAALAPCHNACR